MPGATLSWVWNEGCPPPGLQPDPFQCGCGSQRLWASFDRLASPAPARPLYQCLVLELLPGVLLLKVLLTGKLIKCLSGHCQRACAWCSPPKRSMSSLWSCPASGWADWEGVGEECVGSSHWVPGFLPYNKVASSC